MRADENSNTLTLQPMNGINAPQRPDCVAEVVGLELRNVVAKYPFESSLRFPGSSRILATETIRVQAATVGGAARAQCQDLGRMLALAGIAARFSADPFPLAGVRCIAAFGEGKAYCVTAAIARNAD